MCAGEERQLRSWIPHRLGVRRKRHSGVSWITWSWVEIGGCSSLDAWAQEVNKLLSLRASFIHSFKHLFKVLSMITLTEGDCYHNSLPLMDPLESRLVLIPCLRTLGMQTYLSVGRWSRSTSRATAAPEQRLIRWCWVDKEGSGCCEKAVVSIEWRAKVDERTHRWTAWFSEAAIWKRDCEVAVAAGGVVRG